MYVCPNSFDPDIFKLSMTICQVDRYVKDAPNESKRDGKGSDMYWFR